MVRDLEAVGDAGRAAKSEEAAQAAAGRPAPSRPSQSIELTEGPRAAAHPSAVPSRTPPSRPPPSSAPRAPTTPPRQRRRAARAAVASPYGRTMSYADFLDIYAADG